MDNRVACVIIASESRKGKVFDRVLPSALAQDFAEVVLVHDWDWTWTGPQDGWREIRAGPVHRNTRDALLKRDAGTLATTAPVIVYLCDDHALAPTFLAELRETLAEDWDVLVPNRYCCGGYEKPMGDPPRMTFIPQRIELNMGEREGYCAGHAGVFRRELVECLPWMSFAYGEWSTVRLWDVHSSAEFLRRGARFCFRPRAGIAIEDLEPERSPWL